jgi:hypothetical protein
MTSLAPCFPQRRAAIHDMTARFMKPAIGDDAPAVMAPVALRRALGIPHFCNHSKYKHQVF